MALPNDMEIVKVILPKSYLPKIDALIAAGQRSRSAIIRRMVERALGIDFLMPHCSANRTEEVPADQTAV